MGLKLQKGKLQFAPNPRPNARETVAKKAKRFDGGGPDESSLEDIEGVVDEMNRAQEAGDLEYFEEDGVVHVRPTSQLLTKIEGDNYV